ncbi:hypothetical protein [Thalassospira xiamenensis]|uniref:hypothetical protein n=1 Tax=Thalassospira xiamenensis TaxID=220697 RepID=UPI001F34749B|nr:hypothetical protein [Thalassospira xiamenensis]
MNALFSSRTFSSAAFNWARRSLAGVPAFLSSASTEKTCARFRAASKPVLSSDWIFMASNLARFKRVSLTWLSTISITSVVT